MYPGRNSSWYPSPACLGDEGSSIDRSKVDKFCAVVLGSWPELGTDLSAWQSPSISTPLTSVVATLRVAGVSFKNCLNLFVNEAMEILALLIEGDLVGFGLSSH